MSGYSYERSILKPFWAAILKLRALVSWGLVAMIWKELVHLVKTMVHEHLPGALRPYTHVRICVPRKKKRLVSVFLCSDLWNFPKENIGKGVSDPKNKHFLGEHATRPPLEARAFAARFTTPSHAYLKRKITSSLLFLHRVILYIFIFKKSSFRVDHPKAG